MGEDVVGPRLQRPVVALDRVLRLAEVAQGHAAVGERRHVPGIQGQGPVIALHRLVQAAQADQGVAAAVPGVGRPGIQRQRALVAGERVRQVAQAVQHHPQPGPGQGVVGSRPQGRRQQLAGFGKAPPLLLQEAQEPQGVRLAGLGRQHGAVEPVRLVQGAGLVPVQRLAEHGLRLGAFGWRGLIHTPVLEQGRAGITTCIVRAAGT